MEVILVLIAVSIALATGFLVVFLWASRTGQFDDTTTPAMRILTDDPPAPEPAPAVAVTAVPRRNRPA